MRLGALVLALVISALPLRIDAQPAGKVPRIGILREKPIPHLDEAFRQGLRDHGYVDGRTIVLEYRWGEGQPERFRDLATELVRLKVDVIVAGGTMAIRAAKQATGTIPIVMALGGDPVSWGFAASLARPGGNLTGVSVGFDERLGGKWIELLKEALPELRHLAVLRNPDVIGPYAVYTEASAAARGLGLTLYSLEARRAEEIEKAFAAMTRERVGALLVLPSALYNAERQRLVELAARNRLPAMYEHREFVDVGGLMSYGPNLPDLFRRPASYVDKILKGANPGDLPIEQPTKFELVINMKTAKGLGLAIPSSLLLRADRVVE
jgi:putative ABC transport system substrate-binding protein